MTIQEVQRNTTSTEFVEWCTFFELEISDFHREDAYLAQIAAECRRPHVKDPSAVQVTDFLIPFDNKPNEKPKDPKRPTPVPVVKDVEATKIEMIKARRRYEIEKASKAAKARKGK